jgi:hypothetical protein
MKFLVLFFLKLFITVTVLLSPCGALIEKVSATPITIGRLPAYRTVKVKVRVKVGQDFPRTRNSISHGVTITSSNGGSVVLTPLTSEIYYTPLTPSVEPLPSNGGVMDPTPTFSGSADPNTTIEIFDGDTLIGRSTADASGNWSFVPPQALSYGRHTFKIRATNDRSLSSEFSNLYEIVIECPEGRFGSSCEKSCPTHEGKVCGGNGECSDGLEGTGTCSCKVGYFDATCALSSNTCAVDLSDGVYTESEWSDIASVLVTNNRVKSNRFYWSSGAWRDSEKRRNTRFLTAPDAWFTIQDVKSCLGYQNGKQVLHLLLNGKQSLGSYSDTKTGREYRLGLGPLSEAGVPEDRRYVVAWKVMPERGGAIHYITTHLQFRGGARYDTPVIKEMRLYREASKVQFSPREFPLQEFSAESDQFIADLSNVLIPIQHANLSMDPNKNSAVEVGVDLVRLQELIGMQTTSAVRLQVQTYLDPSNEMAGSVLRLIDTSEVGSLSDFATQVGLGAPAIKVTQRKPSRVTLHCIAPEGIRPSKFVYRLRRAGSEAESTFTRTKSEISTRVIQGGSYETTCSFVTSDGERSPSSNKKSFTALIRR